MTVKEEMKLKTDIQIAQEAQMLPIREVAERAGIAEEDLEFYGKYKAKLSEEFWDRIISDCIQVYICTDPAVLLHSCSSSASFIH